MPTTPAKRPRVASHIFYFRENLARKSTIFWSVVSGSSPGSREATAITAVKRAVNAPIQANKSWV